ncbi:Yip1 family protein [Streptomyces sp. NBC_00083]|uniref:Yip1 family protein n=1 Tax=Streptomyces sp. NBC_00083 TaxID=2975647 RepID=UPI00225BDFD2|nr:Yip1 family protein [Streptomyces sp. NBC_00083]MCX5388132.1 YIP1 family protein [Streptomyces sp. NBC_00083]
MAGFRMGRGGRDNNRPPRQPQQQGQQQAPAQQWPGAQQQPQYGHGQGQGQQRPQGYGQGEPPQYGNGQPQYRQAPPPQQGEPEYFGDPYYQGQGGPQGYAPAQDPYANNPGHTQAFSIGDDAYGDGATYRAGGVTAPPSGPRLHWKELLSGIVMRPGPTFWQMRDHPVWGPALIVTFLYGMLAIFGFDKAREDVISTTLGTAVPVVLITGLVFVAGGLILGAVTHTMARQLGGDGEWQPTIGLSMLIMAMTDAPRLLFALFLGGDNGLVQVLGWVTWLAAGALFTSMVSKSHDLPWPKALGASAIQLIGLLSLIKLGTI